MVKKAIQILILFILFRTEAQTSVLNYADSLYANGNFSKAIISYQDYQGPIVVNDKIAKAYIAIGNYDEALKYYDMMLKDYPDNTQIRYEYAKLLSKTKKFERASKEFNTLVYTDYRNPNYHYEWGLVLEQLEDSTAMNRFRSAYDLDPTHQKAIYKIAKELIQKRQFSPAERYINIGLETYENNVELISLKAQNFYLKDDYRNAIVWFEKLLQLGESSEFIHEKLSLSYANVFNYQKAIEQRKLALKYNPYDASAIYVIGTYYEELQDYENAEKYVKHSLTLKDLPLDQEYQFLAKIYNQQKKYPEAIEALKKSERENPENEFTQFLLVLTKDKYYADIDAKIKVYNDFKAKHPQSTFLEYIDRRVQELKEEKFMKED